MSQQSVFRLEVAPAEDGDLVVATLAPGVDVVLVSGESENPTRAHGQQVRVGRRVRQDLTGERVGYFGGMVAGSGCGSVVAAGEPLI